MTNFKKLNRAEMKSVTGGIMHGCVITCDPETHLDGPAGKVTYIIVPDCSDANLTLCSLGGNVLNCGGCV